MPDNSSPRHPTGPMSAAELTAHPLFPRIDRRLARHLIAIHEQTPRLARLKASHRKWLMTQSLYALTLERTEEDPDSGLSASRLVDIATSIGAVSHNTARAFLQELLSYKFLMEIPNPHDKRLRLLDTTEASRKAMTSWFMGHMSCLDELDDGGRHARCQADIRIFRAAQPRAARRLIENPLWRYPAESINSFLQSELGGMILHEIISRIDDFTPQGGKVIVGPSSVAELAARYFISVTNLRRMFKKAETSGLMGWAVTPEQRVLWLSAAFLDDYFLWQAQKFAALDEAYCWAVQNISGETHSATERGEGDRSEMPQHSQAAR
ncbi:hypothetical protein IHE39_11550 [Aminobacter carboxidus]|uniref:Uncharacterized protein n=2 Tax=Aminobacter carboxidus TaxID=376165 RepID=A0ABR9GMN3_9HYPH|nr:hypothetical protein [Aminobacter carboxidus]